jgi:hypothetical protein
MKSLRASRGSSGAPGDRPSQRAELDEWCAAGLLDAAQVERILAYERARQERALKETSRGWQAEAVGYVGAAFALSAALLLLAEFYSDLLPQARAALALIVMLASLGSGAALVRSDSSALRRLTGVLWAGALAATAWTASVVADELLMVTDGWLPTAVGLPTFTLGLLLLLAGRHELVQLATLVALLTSAVGVLTAVAPLPPEQLAIGTLVVGIGLSWGLAGAGGWLGPRWTAELTGGLVALVGSQVIATGDRRLLGLVLGITLAAGAVPAGVATTRPRLLGLGAVGLFVLVPQLVFELFADTLGAPATLLAVGVVLILLAVGLGRARRVAGDSSSLPEEVSHDR